MSQRASAESYPTSKRGRAFGLFTIVCLPMAFALTAVAIKAGWLVANVDPVAVSSSIATNSSNQPATTEQPAEIAASSDRELSETTIRSNASVKRQNAQTLFFSIDDSTTFANGLTLANEDIAAFDGTEVVRVFDGSDLGLAKNKISSFSVTGSLEILMTFSSLVDVVGIDRSVRPTDIVRFNATQLGEETSGTFELYFVGANVGLDAPGENIDALKKLDDGRLVISTLSSFSVPNAEGNDEDLVAFSPTAFGDATAGSWEFFLDGSDIEWTGQDIDGVGLDHEGNIYFSSNEDFTPAIGPVSKNDIIRFMPTSLGKSTAGSYTPSLVLDGSDITLDVRNIKGLDVAPSFPMIPVTTVKRTAN